MPAPVFVIVVNWNCWRDSLAAVRSVEQHASEIARAIVVDNASTDGSRAQLRAQGVEVLAQTSNLGFAAACNIGAQRAFAQGAEHVFFLNPDATITENTLQALVAAAESTDRAVALGSLIKYLDDGEYQFVGSRENPKTGRPKWIDPTEEPDALLSPDIETDYIMGAALFITKRAYELAGPIPEEYFLYYEETAWCYSARRVGVLCRMVPSSIVLHEGSATVGSPFGPLQSYFCSRNELLFLQRYGTRRQLGSRIAFYIWWLVKLTIKGIFKGRLSLRGRAISLGLVDYFKGRFGDCPPQIRRYAAAYKLERAWS